MNEIILSVVSFVSCTACPNEVRSFLDVPAGAKCEMVKWKLDVSDDGKYELDAQWGYYVNNATWEMRGEVQDSRGSYKIDKGIYTFSNKQSSLSMLKLNKNMFQLVDKNGKLIAGSEAFANMLTRTDPVTDRSIDFARGDNSREQKDFMLTGRTPLRPFDKELPIVDNEDHDKIKWRIKFYADGRLEVRKILEHPYDWKGTWTVENNIYKLSFEGKTLTLLKASDDVFYFLSRDGGLMPGDREFGMALIRHRPSGQ